MFNKQNGNTSAALETAPAKRTISPAPTRSASAPSLLGRDLIITGDIKTDGEVQIDGRLDGNLTAGTVTIGEQGAVNGKVIATNVHVRGKVSGKIDANTIELSETANVQADLIQDQLMIANGAFFDGKCARKSGASAPIKSAKKTS
jgi:cytoskeletal protein CcmA (bactofilin family)